VTSFTFPPATAPQLVPNKVSTGKFAKELENWDLNAESYGRRGWLMLERNETSVTIAFLAQLPLAVAVVSMIAACVRFDYSNYDLWPPSLTFIDPFTREPTQPFLGALYAEVDGPRNALAGLHPMTGMPFLCLPGVREYHAHPQHSGDDWLLHRAAGEGRLAVLCDHIWQRMVRTVIGLRVQLQTVPPELGGVEFKFLIAQGDPEALAGAVAQREAQAQAEAQQAGPSAGHPIGGQSEAAEPERS
jgi:hypothetical protein